MSGIFEFSNMSLDDALYRNRTANKNYGNAPSAVPQPISALDVRNSSHYPYAGHRSPSLHGNHSSPTIPSAHFFPAAQVNHSSELGNGNLMLSKGALFVGDLSFFTSESDLRRLFSSYGRLKRAEIKRGRFGDSLMHGFVELDNLPHAQLAIQELDGAKFMGRRIRVHWAYSNAAKTNSKDRERWTQLHVTFSTARLDLVITEEVLDRFFGRFGEVADVTVKKHTRSIDPAFQSGYAFVYFFESSPAVSASEAMRNIIVDDVRFETALSFRSQRAVEATSSSFDTLSRVIVPSGSDKTQAQAQGKAVQSLHHRFSRCLALQTPSSAGFFAQAQLQQQQQQQQQQQPSRQQQDLAWLSTVSSSQSAEKATSSLSSSSKVPFNQYDLYFADVAPFTDARLSTLHSQASGISTDFFVDSSTSSSDQHNPPLQSSHSAAAGRSVSSSGSNSVHSSPRASNDRGLGGAIGFEADASSMSMWDFASLSSKANHPFGGIVLDSGFTD